MYYYAPVQRGCVDLSGVGPTAISEIIIIIDVYIEKTL